MKTCLFISCLRLGHGRSVKTVIGSNMQSQYDISSLRLFDDARLVCGYHVLDVDVRVWSAASLKHLERLLDEVAHVLVKALVVVDAVTRIDCKKKTVVQKTRTIG